MTKNSADLCAYLKRENPSCCVLHNANISYINSLEDSSQTRIFLCNEEISSENVLSPRAVPTTVEERIENLDLTGSPLKDECDVDMIDDIDGLDLTEGTPWSEAEESYRGVPVSKCRKVLNDPSVQAHRGCPDTSLWILCDAADTDKTVLQMFELSEKYNSRGIVVYRGIVPAAGIDVQSLAKQHLRKIYGRSQFDTKIDSFFLIRAGMILKLTSTTSSPTPILDDFRNSETLLYQTVRLADVESNTSELYWQLILLAVIMEDIIHYKEQADDSKEPKFGCGNGITLNELREQVSQVLTDLSAFDSSDLVDNTCELEAVVKRAKNRNNIDVTDKLWEILKNCGSYKDLKAGFNIVFQCAAKCNIVNPPTNNNRLAEIIREVSERRLAIPCLTGSEPLELLLEIGLEKLTKDYEYIFSESKICSVDDLGINKSPSKETGVNVIAGGDTPLRVRKSLHGAMQAAAIVPINTQQRMTLLHTNSLTNDEESDLIGFQNSKFSRKEIEYKISRLAHVHLALEHLLQIQVHLNLENVDDRLYKQLLNRPMQAFDTFRNARSDRIEIPIETDSIVAKLASKDPHARRIVMTSKNTFKEVQTTYYYNIENIFPPATFKGIDQDVLKKETTYHSWEYSKFMTRRS
ncbi:unnamed protein product [Hermetia illucens]|uniref:Protein zwilch n=1 Tax=Hermetia illucens TaxID=343691 RepID=A0A7R8V491_HERIL|nr:protein zwilch isoform X2 [Hermetia illucens]CAD7091852.1 unnamed protein product [Hermetia illucens]